MEAPKIKVIFKCLDHNITFFSDLFLSLSTISIFMCAHVQICVWIYSILYALVNINQVIIASKLLEQPVPLYFRNSFSPVCRQMATLLQVIACGPFLHHEAVSQCAVMVLAMLKHLAGRIM